MQRLLVEDHLSGLYFTVDRRKKTGCFHRPVLKIEDSV